MSDYKDLVNRLKNNYSLSTERDAADAIEQLVKERDAAVADIRRCCDTCKNSYLNKSIVDFEICKHNGTCGWEYKFWEWRGVQEVSE